MQFRVRRQTLIRDIWWADPYGDNWGWFSETNCSQALIIIDNADLHWANKVISSAYVSAPVKRQHMWHPVPVSFISLSPYIFILGWYGGTMNAVGWRELEQWLIWLWRTKLMSFWVQPVLMVGWSDSGSSLFLW